MSIFTDQASAIAFVEAGRELAQQLQQELGDTWVVEYYQEPTQPHRGFRPQD